MKLRDLIAAPFAFIGIGFLALAGIIGGQWTARRLLEFMKEEK